MWLRTPPRGAPSGGPINALRETMACCRPDPAGLSALSGGMVGFFAYDFVRRLERLPQLAVDDLGLPDMLLMLATDLAAFDHHEGTITLIANAVNWDSSNEACGHEIRRCGRPARRDDRGARAAAGIDRRDLLHACPWQHRAQCTVENTARWWSGWWRNRGWWRHSRWCPSQRFEMDTDVDPPDVYRMLRVSNPSPCTYFPRPE